MKKLDCANCKSKDVCEDYCNLSTDLSRNNCENNKENQHKKIPYFVETLVTLLSAWIPGLAGSTLAGYILLKFKNWISVIFVYIIVALTIVVVYYSYKRVVEILYDYEGK